MNIVLNGEINSLSDGATLATLIDSLGLGAQRFAIEINEEVVRRSEYQTRVLSDGDQVEVVQAIGGG